MNKSPEAIFLGIAIIVTLIVWAFVIFEFRIKDFIFDFINKRSRKKIKK